MPIRKTLFALASLTLLAGAAQAAPMTKMMETSLGSILTDDAGMTLYTFDADAPGTSNCYDACAVNWPPFAAGADDAAEGEFSIVSRKDGTLQWAYDGHPLYYWINDAAPGDTTGDGVKGVWHVVK